jgi:hypothetical protein
VVGPHWFALLLAVLLYDARVAPPTSTRQPRRYVTLPVRVDTLRDGARDDMLARPLLLTADAQRIYWFDYGDGRLTAMDTTGRLLWRAGRRGQGPGEFANPTSLLAVRGGGVVVVDGGAARFARIDDAGRFVRLVSSVDIPQRLARGPGSTLLAFGGQSGRPTATQLDSAFAPMRTLPWAGWPDSASGLATQLRVASGAAGQVAAVSTVTARIFPLRPGTLALDSGVDGLDARPLPPRVPLAGDNGLVVAGFPAGTKPAIRDAAIVGEYLFVIPAGEAFEGRTLDIYGATTGRYLASLRLPMGLNVLKGRTADLVAVSLEEYPAILRIRWDAAALARVVR